MHVLVTGASGLIGSHIMIALLEQGHTVTATDINPLPQVVLEKVDPFADKITFAAGDLTDCGFVDTLYASSGYDGVAHIGGIRSPVGMDPRAVHNINVAATYNVLQTAAARGVRRIIQASSCNALGLSWTRPEHWQLDYVPVDENHPMRPVSRTLGNQADPQEDPYSLSKL
jgi:nucleoside-diphosphate-sugar epimerase